MSHTVRVEIDPVHAAVSKEFETRHIVGDDDGERLMGALGTACAAATEAPIASVHTAKPTLADVPYHFLRVEVDEHGQPKSPSKSPSKAWTVSDPGERRGLMSEYFTAVRRDGKGIWHNADNSPAFSDGFPNSADNIDCNRLVSDLEDANDLLDRDVTRWVLWAGFATDWADTSSGPVFDARRRLLTVKDLIEFLNDVREGLAPIEDKGKGKGKGKETETETQAATTTASSPPTICFIVAISYRFRYRTKDVPPAPMTSTGGMMLSVPLASTLTFFTSVLKKHEALFEDSDSSDYYSSSDEDRDFYDSETEDLFTINELIRRNNTPGKDGETPPRLHNQTVVRYDKHGRPYYVHYDNDDDYHQAMDERFKEFKQQCSSTLDQVLVYDHTEASSSTGRNTPDSVDAEAAETETETETKIEATAEEPATPVSILETLDTNAAKGDAVEGDLHALLPEAHSPTDQQWRACCELLCIHPDEHKDAQKRSVKIPGTENMWVKPSQLWTAYWMLASRLDRNLCGGVLADVMGTGKTYVVLVVCLLRAYIAYNRAEVEREWQLREHEGGKKGGNAAPKQHLPRNTRVDSNSASSTPCTCGNAMGIECYANPGGITRRLAERMSRGAALILAPQTVLDNWVKTVKAVRLQAKYYEPVVFNAKMTKEDIVMAPAPRLKQKLQMDVRPQPHVSGDGLFPPTWVPNVHDVAHEYKPSIAKDAYPERFLLFATHMPEKLTEFFQLPVPLRRKAGAGARERKTVYGCPVGIQLVDEFHKAKNDVIALAQQHKHLQSNDKGGDSFDFWAITGTPLPAKLTDLENITDIVQRLPEWDDPASSHHGSRVFELRKLQEAYEKAIAEDGTPEQASEFRTRAEKFFHGGLVKRHTEASTFFGKRIFSLQDIDAKVAVHNTPDALKENVGKIVARVGIKIREAMAESRSGAASDNNWEQAVRSSSLFNHMMDLEILATFPGAARLMLASPPIIDFGLAAIRTEIRKVEDHDVTKIELFQKHLDTVIEGSPHMATILATLDAMARDKQKRRALPTPVTADANTRSALPKKKLDTSLKKLVVLCPRMGEAIFVYLALRKLRPDFNPVFLHADLKLAERTALLQNFNRLDAPTPAGVVHCARVLVGTFRDAGTGNDLTVANYQILTGPLRLRSQQDQAFGRTNREGQTLKLQHKLLVTEDSPVDRIVMATQARRHIVSDPFNMDERLELAAIDEADK